ncbi:helix-turn-helix transcriptional regulator (plasmid) [Fructilactobacillus ixorae]|uniref:Helix-turn-helix transcriptional regulator n=1 Tax=Fructilactobacillus ixorae TaxID=1750535 RepID=A0ABY5C6E9_9LACO|nr:helix-turn-helix transcriptional regulator [Fructilactobacillus ixorae]USS93962.1 helix-turn-helix transcriptional regulator [Fructilactobacillus ixorae]
MLSLKAKNPKELQKMLSMNGFSIRSFSKKINSSPAYTSRVIKGVQSPYPPFAKKMADGLGVKIDDIFFADDGCKSKPKTKEALK